MNNSRLLKTNSKLYWFCQAGFWLGMSLITFFTLTMWYGQIGWPHITHIIIQALLGILFTLPLTYLYNHFWHRSIQLRIFVTLTSVALVALVWTIARIVSFIWITGAEDIWSDFGGWFFGAIFVFLCWAAFYYGASYFQLLEGAEKHKNAAKESAQQENIRRLHAESQAKEAQLMMLRYQLNPHFLFNTLNAINSLIAADDPERARKVVVQLSQFLRYSLDNNPHLKVPLKRELQALSMYLEIEKTRFEERLNIDIEITDELKHAMVPSLVLQPLVENSMKYAIAKNPQGGTLKLRAQECEENKLAIHISDTGSGESLDWSKVGSSAGRGIGLSNTLDRLDAFYPDDHQFKLSLSQGGGLKTTMIIPLEFDSYKPQTTNNIH